MLSGLCGDYNSYGHVELYMQLRHLARRLSTIDLQLCNGLRGEDSYSKAQRAVNKTLDEVLMSYKLHWYHQGDPRGASLYVAKMNMTASNYNQLGIAIY